MNYVERHQATLGLLFSFSFIVFFILWAEFDPGSLHVLVREDGVIETLSAIFYGLSSICFFMFAYRSDFLREQAKIKYFITICWALLMFVFMGEEISWGQRIFDISTPEALMAINAQNELNIHNIEIVNTFMGGKYRYLSIMMLVTGLLLPLFALSNFGKKLIKQFAFPVSPLFLAPLFVGAYVFGKYYHLIIYNDAAEVREFLMGLAMFTFALTGALKPCTFFRVCDENKKSDQ